MPKRKLPRFVPAIVGLAFALGGCSSVADVPLIGVPANAPPRPESSGTYLPVHDMPPPRQEEMMSLSEQTRIAKELTQARDKGKAISASDAASIAASSPNSAKPKPKPKQRSGKKSEKDAKTAQ